MIKPFLIGSMRNFVYVIARDGEAFIVDPQPDLAPWEKYLTDNKIALKGVLLTHTHHDHVGGVAAIVQKYGVPVHVHELDSYRFLKSPKAVQDALVPIEEGQKLPLGKTFVEVLHTPGHSAGECCFLLTDQKPFAMLTGDTVFVGMVGRTDLETGSDLQLFETLQRLKRYPGDTVVYPGHHYGQTPTSTLEQEWKTEAFLCRTVDELARLP